MAERKSLNRKEKITEGILEHEERRKNIVSKDMSKCSRLPSPLEFSKSCLMTEEKLQHCLPWL